MFYLSKCCFVCLNNRLDLRQLQDDNCESLHRLEYCIPELTFDIDYPLFICDECNKKLSETCEFKKTCIRNYELVTGYLTQLKNAEDINENIRANFSVALTSSDLIENDITHESEVTAQPLVQSEKEEFELTYEYLLEELKKYGTHINQDESENVKNIHTDKLFENNEYVDFEHYEFNTSIDIKTEGELKSLSPSHEDEMKEEMFPKGPYKCNFCEKTYSYFCDLKKHRVIHRGQSMCDTSGKACPSSAILKSHYEVHIGEKTQKTHTCNICGKKFYYLHSLQRHSVIHNGEETYKCGTCGEYFTTSNRLKSHRIMMHNPNSRKNAYKRHICDICGKNFLRFSKMQEHRRIHTGERPYRCDICNKTYKDSSNLKRHCRTHGEKIYKCITCGESFSQRYDLQNHIRIIHGSEKPYSQCNVCNKTYALPHGLRRHRKNVNH